MRRVSRVPMSNDDYKKMCYSLHGDKYDLSKVEYKSMHDKVTVICPIHGEFSITAYDFSHKRGCPKCGRLGRKNVTRCKKIKPKEKLTTEEFIRRSKEVHGDKYDYSKTEYVNSATKVCIICPKHGEFWQIPHSHLKGIGCQQCGREKMAKTQSKTTESFIREANVIHNNKYNYDKTVYNGCYSKVTITCPIHGDFQQSAYSHIVGHGCPKCMTEENSIKTMFTKEEFIKRSLEVHKDDGYDYSEVDYKGARVPVKITCNKGHVFYQMPYKHIQEHGCPYCTSNVSKDESKMQDFIKSNYSGITLLNNRKILDDAFELDVYLPMLKLGFEFDGLYWHNELKKDKSAHLKKTEDAESKGIQLIHIFEDEWKYKQDIVKSRILNLLHKTERNIYARKCIIKEIDSNTSKDFINSNHLQGNVNALVKIGLFYDDELVSVMTFGNLRKNLGQKSSSDEYELLRFCNKLNTNVIGGASKLLSYFIRKYTPKRIISYADRRWSCGELYEKLGFSLKKASKPNYFYIIDGERKNRFNYRKDKLVKEGFDKNKSEHEIMLERGIYRIYDCGCLCYEMTKFN